MKRLLMLEKWNKFSRAVGLEKTPAVQQREMKRAFYAGAHTLLSTIIQFLTIGDDINPADLEMLSNLHDELQQFAKDLIEGRA